MAQPTEYEQVTYNSPDGAQICRTSTDAVAFYGGTPTVKTWPAGTNISTTASISTAGVYGVATSTEMLQITSAVSTMMQALKALNIV